MRGVHRVVLSLHYDCDEVLASFHSCPLVLLHTVVCCCAITYSIKGRERDESLNDPCGGSDLLQQQVAGKNVN